MSDYCPLCGQLKGHLEPVAYHGMFGLEEGRKWVPHECPAPSATEAHRLAMGYEVIP